MNALEQLLTSTGQIEEPTPTTRQRSREILHTAVLDLGTDAIAPARSAWTRRRSFTLAGVAAAAVAAVIAVPVISVGGGHPSANADASTVLRAAGTAAGTQPGGWPDAAYWHSTSTYVHAGKTYQREIWIAHQGQSVLRDSGVTEDSGVIALGSAVFPAGGTSLTWDQLYALPTDPGRLKSVLQADIKGAGPDDTTELFVIVGDLLRESPAPPALREALYDVAAGIAGVHVSGNVTDAAGRAGTAVERGGQTYVIDRGTGQLLAETETGVTYTYLSQESATSAPVVPAVSASSVSSPSASVGGPR
jgi:hypothetical protein